MSRVTLPHTQFTADEFIRMVEADVFGTTRVELLNGRVYLMTQRERHMTAMSNAADVFPRVRRPGDWTIFGGTLRLDSLSMPDPDVLWLPVPKNTPYQDWPDPILVIEISETTYRKDSGLKLRKYARRGIPDYWIENLKADRIEVYRDPKNPTGDERDCRYASVEYFTRGQTIGVLARPDVSVNVDDLLP